MSLKSLIGLVTILSLIVGCGVQKEQIPFTGVLEYKITPRDTANTALAAENSMFVYTNDTITRTENFTGQLGKQVAIRHMEKDKSYLLLITDLGKFAIQTDHSKSDTTTKVSQYEFKKKSMKTTIAGKKANKMLVSHPNFQEPIEFLYLKEYSNKYINIYPEIPGLLVKYSIATEDGILDYELVKINEYTPNRDLFGIPSDFERITFDEFLDKMIAAKKEAQQTPR
ncbi:MAG: hypothetical protein ACPGVI_04495 [Crocinitomicaceae bacterium]